MKLRNRDIARIIELLTNAERNGHHTIAFQERLTHFCAEGIRTFKDTAKANAFSYDNSDARNTCLLARIKPVLERLIELKEKSKVFEDKEGTWSIPIDIPQIIRDYEFNTAFKTKIMDEKNVEYLEKQLLMTGMGEIPREDLIGKMSEGQETFTLSLEKTYGNDKATATPIFRQSDKGNYFYNSFDMVVQSEGKDDIKQNFRINRSEPVPLKIEGAETEKKEWINSNVTFKEAFNLLQGRSVNKNFVNVDKDNPENNQKYNAWMHLDVANPDANGKYPVKKVYDFDVSAALGNYAIKELQTDKYKTELLDSLKRGNLQSVTFIKKDETTEKMYIAANPRFGALKIFDANMKPVNLSIKTKQLKNEGAEQQQEQGESSTVGASKNEKTGQKAGAADDEAGPAEKEVKKRKQGIAK